MSRTIIGNNITEGMLGNKIEENLKEVEKEAEALELNGEFDAEAELKIYEEEKMKAKGCKFCGEVNCIVSHSIEVPDEVSEDIKRVASLVRFDSRPEDDIFQIDVETIYEGKDGTFRGGFSDDCVDINFCPVCGRKLRKDK